MISVFSMPVAQEFPADVFLGEALAGGKQPARWLGTFAQPIAKFW
jgi:hypothetical protein